jgi:hypothetical protein
MDIFPPLKQRPCLLEFQAAIDSRTSRLRRDECGDWRILGGLGHVYAVPEGFQLYVTTGGRVLKSSWVKKKLAFCRLTQDGDDEGCLDRLPTMAEGAIIREALAIPKARHLSDERRERQIAALTQSRLLAGFTAKSGVSGIPGHPGSGGPILGQDGPATSLRPVGCSDAAATTLPEALHA